MFVCSIFTAMFIDWMNTEFVLRCVDVLVPTDTYEQCNNWSAGIDEQLNELENTILSLKQMLEQLFADATEMITLYFSYNSI